MAALRARGVQVLYATPAQLRLMVEAGGVALPDLRLVIVGGEQISPREMELYRLWSAQERKQGQWAPKVGGGGGSPGPRPTGRRVTF